MTERIYYTDAYATTFNASVIEAPLRDGRRHVVLDRTAFYPTSGGQPFDTGTLGGARVVDVIDREEDGTIVHVVEGDVPSGVVTGEIDWARRFDHMQQHTGQHVLSAAIEQECGVATVSFHLGAASATIDLARELTADEIAKAEDAANAVVWEDRPVSVRFVDAEEAARLPLRKAPARTGRLRIVDVDGYDVSACGGTHVARTGAIGIIAVGASERFKGGTRLEFRCGVRALRSYRTLRDTAATAARLMSAGIEDLPAVIERLQTDNRDVRRTLKTIQGRIAELEAAALADTAEPVGDMHVVAAAIPDVDAGALKSMAMAIAVRSGYLAVLLTSTPPLSVVISRGLGVTVDASALLKELISKFGGKGGGRPDSAQGGGIDAPPDAAIEAVRGYMRGIAGGN